MNTWYRLSKFIEYRYKAKTRYYLHSPFVYQFYLNVLQGKDEEKLQHLKHLRSQWAVDNTIVKCKDYGTGPAMERTIGYLTAKVAVKHKYGLLLHRLVKQFKPNNILEVGTSIGISSAYMALGNTKTKVTTLEGCEDRAAVARRLHSSLNLTNVEVITGRFEDTLPQVLQGFTQLGLAFIDGNHTYEATLAYFRLLLPHCTEETVLIFDDIYWSPDMTKAWNEIKQHPAITLTLDVYQFGICFFRKEKLAKEDFQLLY